MCYTGWAARCNWRNCPELRYFAFSNFTNLSQEISIGQAIERFLRKSRLMPGIQSMRIEEVWESVMGKTIAKYTDKVQLVQATLFDDRTRLLETSLGLGGAERQQHVANSHGVTIIFVPSGKEAAGDGFADRWDFDFETHGKSECAITA